MRISRNSFVLSACIICLMSFQACLDIETTSQVNTDGSIVRTITITGDSASIYSGRYPLDLDSSWSKSIAKIDANKFKLTAMRSFKTADEMTKALEGTFGKTVQYRFEFKKSFQWFFTVYRFQESNLPYVQYSSIPISEYVSKAELDMLSQKDAEKSLQTKGDSLAFWSAVERVQDWELRNKFEPVFASFLKGVSSLNSPSLTVQTVELLKDSLYRRSTKAIDKRNIDTLRLIFADVLRNPLVHKAWRASERGFEDIKRKIDFEHEANSNSYVTSVVMPGLITNSNAGTIEGNKATWRDFKDQFHYVGFTMNVESRQVNWWAVVITLIVVITLLAGLVLSALRRRA